MKTNHRWSKYKIRTTTPETFKLSLCNCIFGLDVSVRHIEVDVVRPAGLNQYLDILIVDAPNRPSELTTEPLSATAFH